ncbi:MAG: hypothetical protein R3D29_15485 [Nitratireductor sp.]
MRMPWPLEPEGVRHFSEGLEEVLVIYERREVIEHQIKQQLFNWRADVRPIVGKFDEKDRHLLSLHEEITTGVAPARNRNAVAEFRCSQAWRNVSARSLTGTRAPHKLCVTHQ